MANLKDLHELGKQLRDDFEKVFVPEDVELPMSFKESVTELGDYKYDYKKYLVHIYSEQLNGYIPNQWFIIASFFVDYYIEVQKYKEKIIELLKEAGLNKAEERKEILAKYTKLLGDISKKKAYVDAKNEATEIVRKEISQILARTNIEDEEREKLIKFVSDYDWWYGGKTIDRGDFYVSPILSLAKVVNASHSYIAEICKSYAENRNIADNLRNSYIHEKQNGTQNSQKTQGYISLQQIFYGAPGTGKSNTIKEATVSAEDEGRVYRTTFHPDSDYSTFVGCYKPTMKRSTITKDGITTTEEKIAYKFVPQAFTKAYVEAWNTTEDVFLVIEEINRGNCAQIFGDLFQLLDRNDKGFSEYPIESDTDLAAYLAEALSDSQRDDIPENVQNGTKLLLPSNLYIWATMNTSDQSLFPIDSAFKRRWEWKYIPITDHREMEFRIDVDGTIYDWGTFMSKINEVINSVTSSEDKKLGYFFAKAKDGVINADHFVGKVLFYLWNDVFKNYGFDNEIFQKEDGTKIAFSEFFNTDGNSNTHMIKLFMKNLGVDIVDDTIVEEDEDGNTPSTQGKNYDKYSVNGEGRFGKNRLATECVREYIKLHPEQSVDEVLNIWRNIGMIVPHFIESKAEYDARIDNSKRSYEISCGDTVIYVAHNGYGSNGKVQELIEAVNSRNMGIILTKVE